MKICVLGAGFIGVTTAYFFAREGYEVTIIDRHKNAGEECSFSNGAQLSYCHAEPWGSLKTLKQGLSWLGRNDKPLLFRFRLDPQMWQWILRFLTYCNKNSAIQNTQKILELGLLSRKILHENIKDFDFNFEYQKGGKLFIFENEKDFETYLKQARIQELMGSNYQILNEKEALAYEPSLQNIAPQIKGYIRDPLDESADAYLFTLGLTEKLKKMPNVEILFENEIENATLENNKITSVKTNKQNIKADKFILCLGAYSPIFAKKIGLNLPIYPIKGYSITADILQSEKAPINSITNYFEKIVFSRLGNKLRVAGTAEFAGYNHDIFEPRIDMLKNSLSRHFPDACNLENITKWACLRPSTPNSLPMIGKTKIENLYLNTGHGTLGWTQNFASAQMIYDIVRYR
ncbi:MAG: D-amino acid dehydrogenase [Rickettsiales bacterium]|nr:D-amino acid dehydrogenase [Rickettsiales bacterium]